MSNDKLWLELNEFLRTQKHWMLNQFQIIMGYIQLGKSDVAFDFIKRSTSEVEGTSIFTQLPNKELGLYLCLIWWKMRENNIALFPIIDKNMEITDCEKVFAQIDSFMDDLKDLYYGHISDKHITWKLKETDGKLIMILKTDDENELPNLYAENNPFWGKVNVEANIITLILEK